MLSSEELIKKAESRLAAVAGASLAQSIIKGILAKNKNGLFDPQLFIDHIVASAAMVATKAESNQLKTDLEMLLKADV